MTDHIPDAGKKVDETRCEPPEELRGVDGWHWLTSPFDEGPTLGRWEPDGWWTTTRHDYAFDKMASLGYRYLSPVLTPAEVAALRAERDDWKRLCTIAEPEVATLRAEVARLRGALVKADEFITNGIELGFIRMPDSSTPDPALRTPDIIRAALEPQP